MSIPYSQMRSLTARRLVAALERDGFCLDRQSGSHRHYFHYDGRRVSISFHAPGTTYPLKTLKRMIEDQAHWNEDDLRRLKLL